MGEAVDILKDLAQLDIDAWHAYGDAIDHIDDVEIRGRLNDFRTDHLNHVNRISDQLRKMGEEPPEFSRDFKGFFIEGMTKLQSAMGTEGALKAMETNEKLTNKKYREALEGPSDPDLRTLLQNHYEDEQRHLSFVQEKLGK